MFGQIFITRRTFLSSLGAACVLTAVTKRTAQAENPQGKILRIKNGSVAQATGLLLGGTQTQIQWRGKEAIQIAQCHAYDANHQGILYYVDGGVPMVSAPDYRPTAGLHVITWVVKDRANRNHRILSFPVYFA